MPVVIEPERASDHVAVDAVVRAAFAHHQSVGRLVTMIRESPQYLPELSLVARDGDAVVGHVMISRAQVVDDEHRVVHDVLTLSPLSVAPTHQGQGIGSALVRAALAAAGGREEPVVVLEGSPAYYPRFGFQDCRDHGIAISLPDWAPPDAGMVYLLPSYDPSVRGRLVYPPHFTDYESDA